MLSNEMEKRLQLEEVIIMKLLVNYGLVWFACEMHFFFFFLFFKSYLQSEHCILLYLPNHYHLCSVDSGHNNSAMPKGKKKKRHRIVTAARPPSILLSLSTHCLTGGFKKKKKRNGRLADACNFDENQWGASNHV